jgi:hypothetical protein
LFKEFNKGGVGGAKRGAHTNPLLHYFLNTNTEMLNSLLVYLKLIIWSGQDVTIH